MDYIANKLLPLVYENREYLKTLHTATIAKSFEDTIIVSFTDWAIDIIRPQSETFNSPQRRLNQNYRGTNRCHYQNLAPSRSTYATPRI